MPKQSHAASAETMIREATPLVATERSYRRLEQTSTVGLGTIVGVGAALPLEQATRSTAIEATKKSLIRGPIVSPAPRPVKSYVKDVRCKCGKCLGSWDGETLVIRRIGLILRGGWHEWTCWGCGRTSEIDLRRLMEPMT